MRLANMCQDVRMRRAGQHNPWHPWGQHWSAWRRTYHKKTCEAFISPRQQRKKAVPFLTLLFPALVFLYPNSRPYLIRLSRHPNWVWSRTNLYDVGMC